MSVKWFSQKWLDHFVFPTAVIGMEPLATLGIDMTKGIDRDDGTWYTGRS